MDVLDVFGHFGRFQVEILLLMIARSTLLSYTFHVVHMTSSNVEQLCSPLEPFQNFSRQEWKECCLPDGNRCQRFEITSYGTIDNATLVTCDKWEYENDRQLSLRSEWDLVCDRKWLLSLLYAAFFAGNLISYPVSGYLADRFGRRTAILIGCIGLVVTNTAAYFSTSFLAFLISRFVSGLVYTFFQATTIIVYTEVVGRKQRAYSFIFTGIFWTFSSWSMIPIAMYQTNWRHIFLISSFPMALPTLIIMWKFLPESPRWLVASKKLDKAREVLEMATRKNGIKVEDMESVVRSLEEKIDKESEMVQSGSIKEIFRHKKIILIYSLILMSYLTGRFLTNGFFVILHTIGGNFYANFAISGGFSVIGSLVNLYIVSTFTRRRLVLLVCFSLSGALFLLATAIGEDLQWLRIGLAMLGRCVNTFIHQTLTLFATEVLPTTVRARGTAICNIFGRIGATCGSFSNLLSQTHGSNATFYLFGSISLATGLGFIFVPDSDNRNLPDTLAAAERNIGLTDIQKKVLVNLDEKPEILRQKNINNEVL